MTNYNDLTAREKEAFVMLPIIEELKQLGGEAANDEIKRALVAGDHGLPEDVLVATKMGKNGPFKPFDFTFNFGVRNMIMAGYLERPRRGVVALLAQGRAVTETDRQAFATKVFAVSDPKWEELSKKKQKAREAAAANAEVVEEVEESQENAWRTKLLDALNNLSATKFETFCRALVHRMNIEIDETIGISPTGDGGLDGYGYLTTDDLQTVRVALQAKKWTNSVVSSPEIDKFRGAMDKFRADYGIFITTSTFTQNAVAAARTGSKMITLVDGDRLTKLVAKYEVYVHPVTTYELDDFFTTED